MSRRQGPCSYSNDRPRYVYLHIDAFGNALYAGSSINVAQRNWSHRSTCWWPYVADTAVIGPFANDDALTIEREFIGELRPWFNTKGVPVVTAS